MDVSDPMTPNRVGAYDTPGQARDVSAGDDLIAVADGDALLLLSIEQ